MLTRIFRVGGSKYSVFFSLVTKVFYYIISKSGGLCGGAMCVLVVWLDGVWSLCVCYGVGVVSLGVWGVLGGRGM